MAQPKPTAAQALYSHLPSAAREPVKQSERTLADAMWPRPKPPTTNPYRESLLKHLKEHNRLAREGHKR